MSSEEPRRATPSGDWVTCACGKRGYPSRKLANVARRALVEASPSRAHRVVLRSYRCQAKPELWHIGHIYQGPSLNDPRLRWT